MDTRRLASRLVALTISATLLTLAGAAPAAAAAPVKVKDIRPGSRGSNPGNMTRAGKTVYFTARTKSRGRELWKTKGSAASTKLVKDIKRGKGSSRPEHLVAVGKTLFFMANGGQVWRTKGTASSTIRLKAPPWWQANRAATMNGKLYWTTSSGLWVSGGKASNTKRLHPVKNNDPSCMHRVGNRIYFSGKTADAGAELWVTDGTRAGTRMVTEINPGPGNAFEACGEWAHVGQTVFFTASDGGCPCEKQLWKANGTPAGTIKVKGFAHLLNQLTSTGGTIYFVTMTDGSRDEKESYGTELWKSDGTSGGTVMVKDIDPRKAGTLSPEGSEPEQLTPNSGTLYFEARDGTHGRELWKSNGTEAGTKLVKDINVGGNASNGMLLTKGTGGWLFLAAWKPNDGHEPFKSKGTAATTKRIKNIRKGPKSGINVNCRGCVARLGSKIFFVGNNGKTGWELWKWVR